MVKRQKEKQYQSSSEHRLNSKLRSGARTSTASTRSLPFDCCALTMTPFQNPVMRVCDTNGIIFENTAILPYLMKHKADPVTGLPMTTRSLITLCMDKDDETGKWQCPVLNKPFLNHTKIVAVIQNDKSNANVYSYEAVHELNYKAKSYIDLISGEKFNKKTDVIVLQDPSNLELTALRDINNFKHTSALRKLNNEKYANGKNHDVKLSVTASRIIDKMKRKRQDDDEKERKNKIQAASSSSSNSKKLKVFTDDLTGVSMTSGKASGSLTSTAMNVHNNNDAREATEEEVLQAKFAALKKLKKKGFVRFNTNLGVIDFELHCDIVPKTCTNFIGLCEKGVYNGTKFHRSIRNFMIQGGKPTSTTGSASAAGRKQNGEKETSLWGEAFEDEFDDRLKHSGAGILAMANSGANTNARQFYISYKSAPHLDRKHTVFGRIVKGIDTLRDMEEVPTDKKDRPSREIQLMSAEVMYSPIDEAGEKERLRIQKRADAKRLEMEERRASALGNTKPLEIQNASASVTQTKEDSINQIVGCYLPKANTSSLSNKKKKSSKHDDIGTHVEVLPISRLPPPPKKTTFGDFSGW